jgi:hypothetical protein
MTGARNASKTEPSTIWVPMTVIQSASNPIPNLTPSSASPSARTVPTPSTPLRTLENIKIELEAANDRRLRKSLKTAFYAALPAAFSDTA